MVDPMPQPNLEAPTTDLTAESIDRIERGLERCPFCNGMAFLEDSLDGVGVACACGARGPVKDDAYDAAAAWNYRPTERRATKRPFNISGPMGVI